MEWMCLRNLVVNIYCSRDRNTKKCLLHESAKRGESLDKQVNACIKCDYHTVELTSPGRALADRGLPRNLDGMNLADFEEDT